MRQGWETIVCLQLIIITLGNFRSNSSLITWTTERRPQISDYNAGENRRQQDSLAQGGQGDNKKALNSLSKGVSDNLRKQEESPEQWEYKGAPSN